MVPRCRKLSPRDLTYESDKLPAISGYAHAVHKILGGHYLVGIWKQDLLIGLLWSASSTCNRLRRPSQRRPLSWSWAAFDGGVNYHLVWMQYGNSRQEFGLRLRVIRVHVNLVGFDSMGQVTGGMLKFLGISKKRPGCRLGQAKCPGNVET
jgi:hypothetical protein